MASTEKSWGITPPISTALPTEAETKASNALLEELKSQGTFESPEETVRRKKILTDLQRIVDEFVRRIAKEREPHNATLIRDARGEVFTYGSYCLGVYGPGSDIDTLVCVPKYVSREDYFKHFPGMLKEMTPKGAITELAAVEDAFVPIIKFEYWEISIDLIFSRIATLTQFPPHGELHLTNNQYLRGLDDHELRSVNGTRVTNEILNLVPEQSTFRLALRAIKLWAQRRAIYANIIGFPGGVVWAMLVARVCQLYPKATSATIVSKFFFLIKRWPWPQPVVLKKMEDGPLNVRVWNPKVYKGDSFHLMPVITPAYPQMCATYNITHSNKTIIQRELDRAGEIADNIMNHGLPWKDLFVKHTFFTQGYKYYLAVIASSTSKEAHKIWSGFVESRVRTLVAGVEQHASIAVAHPFNKGFPRAHRVNNAVNLDKVRNGVLEFMVKDGEDDEEGTADAANGVNPQTNGDTAVKAESNIKAEAASPDVESVPGIKPEAGVKAEPESSDIKSIPEKKKALGTKVWTTTHYIGLELAEGAKSLDLSYYVNEYKERCQGWEKYDPDLNFLSIQHVKNVNLPDDVFEAGETKPTRAVRKTGPTMGSISAKKRPAPSPGHPPPPKRQQSGTHASVATTG